MSRSFFLYFLLKGLQFQVLILSFNLIQVNFCQGCKTELHVLFLFVYGYPLSPSPFIETAPSPLVFLLSLSKINWPHICGCISGLFCSASLCLFLCQYHPVLITITLKYFEIRKCDPPALFIFLKIPLAMCFWFHINFRIIFFYFCEKCHWSFVMGCSESVDCSGGGRYNNINSSNPGTLDVFLFVCVFSSFFYQCLVIFRMQIFSSPRLNLFLIFYYF